MNPGSSSEVDDDEHKQAMSSPSASTNRGDEEEEFDVTQQQRRPAPAQYCFNYFATMPSQGVLPRYADHTYRDFSTYIEKGGKIERHKKSDRNFPARLHAMLSDERYSHIISWMPHGRAWKVHNKELLVEEVIPKYFGQSNFASFTRQLSGWGFKRLHKTSPDVGCYYHECFLRGHSRLTGLMRRIPSGQGRATPDAINEPDFYTIAKQSPLEKSDGAPEKDEEQVQEKAEAPSPGRQTTEYLGDESSKNEGEDVPLAARAAFGTESPSHSFVESADADADRRDGVDDEEKSSVQAATMNYDPSPMPKNHQLGSPRRGYSMHPSDHDEAALTLNQHFGSNDKQYAAAADDLHQAIAAAGYFNSPPPQHSQQHDAHNNSNSNNNDNMFIDYNSQYGNPYDSNHSARGLAQGHAQPAQGGHMAQMNYPTQSFHHDYNPYLPSFSPLRYKQDDNEHNPYLHGFSPLKYGQDDDEELVVANQSSTLQTAAASSNETADSLLERAIAHTLMWKETALAALKEVEELKKKISKTKNEEEKEYSMKEGDTIRLDFETELPHE